MKLHEDKFELLCYRTNSSKLLRELPFPDEFCQYVTPGGYTLSPKHVVKDLGVYLEDNLTWSHNIHNMIISANKMAAWVLGVFKDRSKPTMMHLYKSLMPFGILLPCMGPYAYPGYSVNRRCTKTFYS